MARKDGRIDKRPRKRQQPGYISPRIIDIRGQSFGAWVVMGDPYCNENGQTTWSCRCECGVYRDVVGQALREGLTKSCGCKMGEAVATARTTRGQSANVDRRDPADVSFQASLNKKAMDTPKKRTFAGRTNYALMSTTYKRWLSMKKRVKDKSEHVWKHYGAKGITIPDRWKDYENFLADMGECPEGWTLDRIDPEKSYSKENCRWATWKQQHRNRMMMEICPSCGKARVVTGGERLEGACP